MKHLSALVISLLIVVAISMYANNGALAYFELDERLIGVPKRTVLPDGRIHIKYDEKVNQPFPEGMKFPATYQGASVYGEDTEPKDHYFNFRGEAVMQARWKDFKLEEHTDADRTVCHERGDKNMRMSIFGASDALKAALKNNMKDIFIHADANKHVCHGNPIFRTVSEAHTFGDEILLVTAKPSYEDLFDEANVAFDLKHPKLTHFSNKRRVVEPDNHDHGVTPDDSDFANAAFPVPKSTAGSNMIPAKHDRMHARDVSEQDGYKINKQTFETDDHIAMLKRKGKTSGWFKKLVKSVTKVVSKVVTVVKSAVSTVTKAVAKGIEVVKKVVDTVKNLLTLTYEKQLNPSFDVEKHVKDYEVKQLKGIKFSLDFEFHAGLKFHLYIQYAKLKIFHASVYGSLDFGAGARLPRVSYTSSGQSNLWDIPGTTITFMIGPVPVWISYSTRCIAGYSMDAGFEAAVGFRVKASARLGVEYTSDNGFRPIAEKNFERSHTLSYSADFSASPFLGAQGRFALYSLITAYAQLNIGLNVFLTTQDAVCNLLKITIDFFIKLSAGLDIELKIGFLGINWSKSFGPWTVFDLKWPIVNVCKKKGSVAHAQYAIAEQAHLKELQENHHLLPQYTPFGTPVLRDAAALSNDEMTSVTEADSGKVWSTSFNCPSSNTTLDITATGFFQNDTTVLYLTISRNITGIPVTNQSNMTWTLFAQSSLAVNGSQVKASSSYIFDLLAPTAANAESLGISHDDIQTLTKAHGDQNTTAINLTSITISFGATMDQMTVQAAALCPANPAPIATNTLANNQTVPAPPVEGSYFGRMMESFGASLFPSFVRLITDVLVTVLIIAILEIAAAMYLAPRLVGEHWPKQATTPRTREYIYAVAGVLTGLLCMIIFIVGANLTFAEITGAQLAPNFTAPVKANESSFLVASGVQTIVWKFNGATVNLNSCPQYFPCSPDCRDLCVKQDRTWTNAPWPYCGDETVRTDNGGCTKFAWDNILNSILFVVFLFVLPAVVVKKCANIYRRLPILHACLMLAGMFLNLIWRRMNSFMTEVQVQMFSPADQMIIPFKLDMNADSQGTWKAAVTIYWLMIGAVAVGSAYDIYLFYKDTVEDRIVKFDQDFDSNAEYNKAGSPTGNARARSNTDINAAVAADLANLGEIQSNEAALM